VGYSGCRDIVVVGAGPAGLSFARLLADSGLKVTIVDKQPLTAVENPTFDGRDIAMTHLSKSILMEMGVWPLFPEDAVHPLCEATVEDGGAPYALHFERNDASDEPLGYLVANHVIRRGLYEAVANCDGIELLLDREVVAVSRDANSASVKLKNAQGDLSSIQAELIVAADSRFSNTRRMMGIGAKMTDYGRVMTVCNMRHELSHNHTAQECFYYGRTCAVLPLGEGVSSIVTTVPATRSAELTLMDDEQFSREMEIMFEHRLGAMTLVSERHTYPLVGAYADRFIGPRFALIGDAAVGMHPVTAHGYNLGLRSADTLASQILKAVAEGADIGSSKVLHSYQWRHRLLARPLYDGTNAIVRLFTDDRKITRLVRKAAVRIGNNLSPFKRLITQRLTQIR